MDLLSLGALAAVRALLVATGYLANQTAFPKPLSEAEESRLLQRMYQGDQKARNLLIEHNLRLVAHIVKKFEGTGEDPDDLISIGTIGLIKGIRTYQPDRGTRLATYAARCVENEILMHLRAAKKTRGEVFLQEPIGADRDGNEITLLDVLQDDSEEIPEQVSLKVQAQRLRAHLQRLTRRERLVLELRYGLSGGPRRTQREVARQLGISRSYVSRIEKKAVTRLCRSLQEEG